MPLLIATFVFAVLLTVAAIAGGTHMVALAACVAWGLHWYSFQEQMTLHRKRHLSTLVVLAEALGLAVVLGSDVHPVFLYNAAGAGLMAVGLWILRERFGERFFGPATA